MLAPSSQFPIETSEHVVIFRQAVRARATQLGFSLVDLTKIVTASSELARNAIQHGGGGHATIETIVDGARQGLRLAFEDSGPGIPDIEVAMREGYSTGGGLGLGLPGSRRLAHEFNITSAAGQGTRVVITRWK